ncbi:hypothetical protein Q7378_01065 [Glaesserella parasuis]|uniref:hypothetical protein n=1 Tax=Glaesserella parasuis TaxID=738 RepID=UPI001A95244B|nr:hypothetical protein [Glaesserella parasuis]MDO9923369.1 hypothetical protein [Glaesserella parasuis]MDO9932553.1 hypothetical protein [Glaesserella parasuis]MDP0021912.1 hypothetical protein [Glaesserella parasuis]MDP0034459.1 hypothetical protein [Glaesserella parasuis]MDP0053122.1 hypothetical protein [Glaesserella parasuis]
MLTRLSLESARELSELLNNRGRVVVPTEETPLEQLVEVSEPISTVTPQDIASSIESLAESTYTPGKTHHNCKPRRHSCIGC